MTEPRNHAILSPSAAHRWMACPGSAALEERLPESKSDYAAEGTCAHAVAAVCLTEGTDAAAYVGRLFDGYAFTDDMVEPVQTYVNLVRDYAKGHTLMVEQRVSIDHITGEAGAEGTADAIVLTNDGEIIVVDLKFGRGVAVSADHNKQGQIYALGALEVVRLFGDDPARVRVVISQPRLSSAPSEWDCTVEELEDFGKFASERAFHALQVMQNEDEGAIIHHLVPGEEQCRFCKAKATCPKLRQHVLNIVADDFVDESQADLGSVVKAAGERIANSDNAHLAALWPHLDLITDWCEAVRKRVHAELASGNAVPGCKLVQGKRGARGWGDETAAEAAMKSMRLKHDQMYQYKLISPTTAEKLLAKDSPRRWATLQKMITQADGKPTVAPASDPRPALVINPAADFEDATCGDLA